MKKFLLMILALAVFAACEKTDPVADMQGDLAIKSVDVTGNGAPSGPHYTLNIIGVDEEHAKTAPLDDNSGHRIFVPLVGKAKIELIEGESFAVLDANAFDDPAQFQLPDPDLDPYLVGGDLTGVDVMSSYSVFVRPLGKPGGSATITTCAELVDSEFAGLLSGKNVGILNKSGSFGGYASVEQVALELPIDQKGKPKFMNVTAELLTIVFKIEVDTDGDGVADIIEYVRVPIFDDIIKNEYWEVDNDGLKVVQVRFYPGFETDVSANDGTWNNE